MPKDFEDSLKEPAKDRATRRWRNYAIEKSIKAELAKPAPIAPKEIEPADVIENERPDGRYSVTKHQTKFAKDIRAMLDEHTRRNLILYKLSIRAQRKRLLMEKLRRLEAREAQRVALQKRDLFG